jgi:predicted RNA-binding Zn-ribbon protein involved in translation (DUF1610 family)
MTQRKIQLDARPAWTPGRNPDVEAFVRAGRDAAVRPVDRPFARDVRATKGSPAYRAHMYHTKVPPEAIEPYIAHYTAPGQTVLDPFCGSGMTGVATIRSGRRALLVDLSPFATFMAYNQCLPVDANELVETLTGVIDSVRPDLERLYRTRCPSCGGEARLRYVVWSDVLRCPACGEAYALWDAALDDRRRVRKSYPCPACGETVVKKLRDRTGSRPVVQYLDCPAGCDGHEAPADPGPVEAPLDGLWAPTDGIPAGLDELSRVRRSGVRTVADLFTPRNRAALARLWHTARRVPTAPLRARALFGVTAVMVRASRLIKYIPARRMAPGPVLGTMYLPSFSAEINVAAQFERRIRTLARAAEDLRPARGREAAADLCISTQSAGRLDNVPDESVHYIFTDPPFGGNLMYSELNFLWESWLGWRTDAGPEAVVSRSQGKGVDEYRALMAKAFAEMYRVLKPRGWMTLVFHNTRADVWAAIQHGLRHAGFHVEAIQTLDKAHETFKQVTADGAVGYDVVVNCRKQPGRPRRRPGADPVAVLRRLLDAAPAAPCKERTARYLHARLTGEQLRSGAGVTLDYRDVLQLLEDHFSRRGRHWFPCPTKKPTP